MQRHLKFLTTFILIIAVLQHKTISTRFVNNAINVQKSNKSVKTILYWTTMYNRKDHYLGLGQKIFENCSYKNCYATYNKNFLPVDEYDALIFHGRDFTPSRYEKPSKRNAKQVYIFSNLESPDYTPLLIKNYDNFYNWTMTYRLDSDVVRRYGSFRRQKTNYKVPTVADVTARRKKIAWFVSHCRTKSQREKLAEDIRKFVPVDIYGSCGELSCPLKRAEECYDKLEKDYKFYLSFENSICEDYVTEKLYNVLKKNVVPIVFGGVNYDVVAPPNSVIDVRDFRSVRSLTDYIKYLDAHPKEYLKYFEWKKDYVVDTSQKSVVCDLCEKLNEPRRSKVYGGILGWWFGEKRNKCFDDLIWQFVDA